MNGFFEDRLRESDSGSALLEKTRGAVEHESIILGIRRCAPLEFHTIDLDDLHRQPAQQSVNICEAEFCNKEVRMVNVCGQFDFEENQLVFRVTVNCLALAPVALLAGNST